MEKILDFIVENAGPIAVFVVVAAIIGLLITVLSFPSGIGAENFDYQGHSYIQFDTGSVVHNPDCGACR